MANTPFCMLLSNIWFHMFEKQGQFGKERKGGEPIHFSHQMHQVSVSSVLLN
ncbi:hypothetical protein E1A91_A01G091200v1 [Gossypium mustelinum]|uniref:Uncharacterized protein n=1 Tax=Gossypium mustelinum TaxID=34275 RepID=A0A5D3AEU1_GOSMU|nr:hypothetical protein E1A91_A01G091200v1 [Gossypium mustelinum]